MTLSSNGDLAIAELVFWAPALIFSGFVTFKHGFGRQLGWVLLVLLALCRIIGSSCTIAAEDQTDPSTGLITAAAITSSIGLSFLISVLSGLLQRVNQGIRTSQRIPALAFRLLYIMLLVGIILGVIGGTDIASGNNDYNEGVSLSKASTCLFAAGLVLVALGTVLMFLQLRQVPQDEKRLVYACIISWPFILIRLIFSLLSVFLQNDTFNSFYPNVYARAFMAIMEEFIVAIIIIAVGIMTPVIFKGSTQAGGNVPEAQSTGSYQGQEIG